MDDATLVRHRDGLLVLTRLLLIPPQTFERVVVGATIAFVLVLGSWTVIGGALSGASGVMLIALAGSVVASCAAVWLTVRRPAVAGVVAMVPFLWLLFDHRWLGVWLVAQLVVVSLAAARSWRLAVVPVLGGLVALLLAASQSTVILTGLVRSNQEAFTLTGNQSWTWQHLSLLGAAVLLPAAVGVLARTDVTRRMLSAREAAVSRAGAVQSERARLAADLHDVVAHNVSLIAVRAETAPYTSPGMDQGSRQVLGEIADDARRALDELRGVLGVLHRAEESPELAPQPSMRDLPELVLRSTRAGDRILTEGIDAPWIVPETVGYVVYRVAQEALTNARRHARGAPVELRLDRDGDELVVVVANEAGQSSAAADSDSGAGLLGMAERVEALGGIVVAGPTAGGGFHVTARLPLGGARV